MYILCACNTHEGTPWTEYCVETIIRSHGNTKLLIMRGYNNNGQNCVQANYYKWKHKTLEITQPSCMG